MNMTYVPGTVVGDLHILTLQGRTWQGRCYHLQKNKYRKVTEKMMEPELNPAPLNVFQALILLSIPKPMAIFHTYCVLPIPSYRWQRAQGLGR